MIDIAVHEFHEYCREQHGICAYPCTVEEFKHRIAQFVLNNEPEDEDEYHDMIIYLHRNILGPDWSNRLRQTDIPIKV